MLRAAFFAVILTCFAGTALAAKALRVGIYHNPPSVMRAPDGSPQGLFVDLLNEIAKIEDWQIEYVYADWQSQLANLKRGEIDLLTSISWSEERDRDYDFVKAPVSVKWGAVYLPKNSSIRTFPDLHDKRVAVQKGDIHASNFIRASKEFAINPVIVETPTLKDVFQAIERGEVDAGVVNNTFGALEEENYRVERSAILFHPTRSTFAAPDGRHADVLVAIDKHLETWRKDKSSVYYQTYNRWYGGKEYVRSVVPQWLIIALAAGTSGLLIFALWNRRLQAEIARRKALEAELREVARLDALTGLPNRKALGEQAEIEIPRAQRYAHTLSLLAIDLDHFKRVNDQYGHSGGDQVLVHFAGILKGTLRGSDYAARIGGEEFVVILPETAAGTAMHLAERLRQNVATVECLLNDQRSVALTVSIGVASYPDHARTWDTLLVAADRALYAAKDDGRNQVRQAAPFAAEKTN